MLEILGQIILLFLIFSSFVIIVLAIFLPTKIDEYMNSDRSKTQKNYILKVSSTAVVSVSIFILTFCLFYFTEWF